MPVPSFQFVVIPMPIIFAPSQTIGRATVYIAQADNAKRRAP